VVVEQAAQFGALGVEVAGLDFDEQIVADDVDDETAEPDFNMVSRLEKVVL
jgi:hypothetical protein